MTEKERFSAYMLEKYNSNVEWFGGKPIKALDLLLWDAWQAATQRDGFKFVPVEPTEEIIDALRERVWHGYGYQEVKAHYVAIYKAMIGAIDE